MAAHKIFISGVAAIIVLGTAAHAELSCSAYIRGAVLQDPDVLAQAAMIAAPLAAISWSSMAMKDEAVHTVPYDGMWLDLLLRQLDRDCRALPSESVDSIVATHLRVARAQQAADEAKKGAARKTQEKYEIALKAKEMARQNAMSAASALPTHIAPVVAVVEKITCGQYLKYAIGTFPSDSEVGRAFTTVLQHAVDKDPAAKTAHIHYDGSRQYDGAFGYCFDHPDGTLANALQEYITTARSAAPATAHKAEQEQIDALRAKSNKDEREKERLAAYDVADRAGARGSCKWWIAYNGYFEAHQPDNLSDSSMASVRARQTMDWCRIHPNASEDALLASGAGR